MGSENQAHMPSFYNIKRGTWGNLSCDGASPGTRERETQDIVQLARKATTYIQLVQSAQRGCLQKRGDHPPAPQQRVESDISVHQRESRGHTSWGWR